MNKAQKLHPTAAAPARQRFAGRVLSPTAMESAFHTTIRFILLFFSGLHPLEKTATDRLRRWIGPTESAFAGFAPAFARLPNLNCRCG